VNYLNGLHAETRYLMPAMAGFYRRLDDKAADVFKQALGDEIQIVRIRTQEIQRQHGSVHCVVSAYPDFGSH
jgi:agmatine/peptidylarginine deiminase